jgi:hypothetical protein
MLSARPTGLEPATSRVTGECSNQLSYGRSSETLAVFCHKGKVSSLCWWKDLHLRPWVYESHALTT